MSAHQLPTVVASRLSSLQRTIRRAERLAARGRIAAVWFSRVRLSIFAVGVIGSVVPHKLGWTLSGNVVLAAALICFLVVAWYHNRLEDRLHRLDRWLRIKHSHVARLRLDWSNIPTRAAAAAPERHGYARDLDVAGPHSLLHLIDTTVSSQGQARLHAWLLDQPAPAKQWAARQGLVREIASVTLLRDRLSLEAQSVDQADIDGRRLQAVFQKRVEDAALVPLLLIETGLAAATIILLVADLFDFLPGYWWLSFALYVFLYLMVRGRSEEIFDHAQSLHLQLEKLSAVLGYLERRRSIHTPRIADLCRTLSHPETSPSRSLRQAASVMNRLSVRAHPLIHYLVNALLPWDLYHTYRLQRVQDRIAAAVPQWLEILAEIDAAAALGTFAYLHPDYRWPTCRMTINEPQQNGEGPVLAAEELAHPLLPRATRIGNSVRLEGLGRIFLVTGSNMSGKSTFLRTVGINTCLAQAGAPVCAREFVWSPVRFGSCIRVDDSLEAGLSYFYAEVKRLKSVLAAAEDGARPPVLFLIDEIFKGTNNRERLIGGRALIATLATTNGFGFITTHDLELAELEHRIAGVTNVHFQETVSEGTLLFDYRLRPGPCPTTNALRIMELEGLPVKAPSISDRG
jgi:hypothetical protein